MIQRASFAALIFSALSTVTLACDTTPIKWKTLTFINKAEVNLHSFLTFTARKPETLPQLTTQLSDTDKQSLQNAVTQYQTFTKQKRFHPLFNNNELAHMTEWFGNNKPLVEIDTTALSQSYFATIGLYKAHIWPTHCKQNMQWQTQLQNKLDVYGDKINQRLSELFLGELISVPEHRVYIHARPFTRQGAFTSARQFVTHMNSYQATNNDWYALELLFHEISHVPFYLNKQLQHNIEQVFSDYGIAQHSRIWHPILFFTVGEVTRQAIAKANPDYQPYANKVNLYKGKWHYLKELEQHWQPYINGQVSMDEALHNLAKAIKERT
ncbi:hypothetical protein PSECIP111951_03202 [Pseudoalteromonas holothuriae]|uniref:DUF2268 domain-containing protein n=1 Tax=Pseudoalteromonas holothuriae TaxID=2963714 RepID=A0A9W4VUD9_9GAMM|nr:MULTISPECIES: hypothetical protein [unclassified Pseudoalteromonas]CAH9063679.1 hypothetical protein PSECIP111854_03271 [Pseudoalteromonas sp. CIP111854]CAH9064719.1 hypothetical protein PSECIP111951_03202 [Pseudoalteromonas sp. CIP111951]